MTPTPTPLHGAPELPVVAYEVGDMVFPDLYSADSHIAGNELPDSDLEPLVRLSDARAAISSLTEGLRTVRELVLQKHSDTAILGTIDCRLAASPTVQPDSGHLVAGGSSDHLVPCAGGEMGVTDLHTTITNLLDLADLYANAVSANSDDDAPNQHELEAAEDGARSNLVEALETALIRGPQ